jgi:hypothetical protein
MPSMILMTNSPRWTARWSGLHWSTRLSSEVAPPSSHDTMWWASHWSGGAPQVTHPRSRAMSLADRFGDEPFSPADVERLGVGA